jgi:hypothetical protein
LCGPSALAADNLLGNGSFENNAQFFDAGTVQGYDGWLIVEGKSSIEMLGNGARDGDYALRLSNSDPGAGAVLAIAGSFTPSGFVGGFAVAPGDEVYAYANLLADVDVVDGATNRIMKIAFFDENGKDIAPAAISKGIPDLGDGGCFQYPGVIADPKLTTESTPGVWQLSKAQAVAATDQNQMVATCNADGSDVVNAPPGAVSVGLFLFNINFSGTAADVYFDDVFLGILQPDDDGDRIENGVDGDPIGVSAEFSDGVTSGAVQSDADRILAIDDSTDPALGVSIVSDPGNGASARVRVCDALAVLLVRPNTNLDVTCGSVSLDIADGSAPVEMEIVIDGQPATLTVPASNSLTYDDVSEQIIVDGSSSGEAVIFVQGDTVLEIAAGEALQVPSAQIDIKPGDALNCFNVDGNGAIPVAVLGSSTLDVADIDRSSLDFAGLDVRVRGNKMPSCGVEDVNADGFSDLVCHFADNPDAWAPGSGFATLRGLLMDGSEFNGSDSLCIVP